MDVTCDTSQVTNMAELFCAPGQGCSRDHANAPNFNEDISGWDVSQVTSMKNMFSGAAAFDQDLSTWCFENGVMGHSGTFTGTPCAGTYCGVTYGGCEAAGLGCVTTASNFLADRVFECWACDAGCFTLEFAFADGGAGSETIGTAFKGGQAVESFAFCIDNCQFARQ